MYCLISSRVPRFPLFISRKAKARRLPAARSIEWSAVVPVALTAALPLSVIADEVVDRTVDRVGQLKNIIADGIQCYLAFPEGFSPDAMSTKPTPPVVFLLPELFGLQRREVEFCQELTRLGYIACAVDTLSGRSTKWIFRALTFLVWKVTLEKNPDYGVTETQKVVKWIRSQAWCKSDTQFGIIGFCYGGAGSIRTAIALPKEFSASVVFYGLPPVSLKRESLRCPVLAIYGTEDNQFQKEVVDSFQTDLYSFVPGSTLVRFPGEGHGFVKDFESTRSPGSSQDAWRLCTKFLQNNLNPRTT